MGVLLALAALGGCGEITAPADGQLAHDAEADAGASEAAQPRTWPTCSYDVTYGRPTAACQDAAGHELGLDGQTCGTSPLVKTMDEDCTQAGGGRIVYSCSECR